PGCDQSAGREDTGRLCYPPSARFNHEAWDLFGNVKKSSRRSGPVRGEDGQRVAQRFEALLDVEHLGVETSRLFLVEGLHRIGDRHFDLVDELFKWGHAPRVPGPPSPTNHAP